MREESVFPLVANGSAKGREAEIADEPLDVFTDNLAPYFALGPSFALDKYSEMSYVHEWAYEEEEMFLSCTPHSAIVAAVLRDELFGRLGAAEHAISLIKENWNQTGLLDAWDPYGLKGLSTEPITGTPFIELSGYQYLLWTGLFLAVDKRIPSCEYP